MPTYQYACKECDHQFEAVQSFSDASLRDCPACAGPLRKLFGSVGVIFKGSGFYRTDSRSGSSSSSTKPSTTTKPESSSASSGDSSSSRDSSSSGSAGSGESKTPAAASVAS